MNGNEIVLKKDLSVDEFNTIKKALIIKNPKLQNVERYNKWKLSETPDFIQFFKEEKDRLFLPRNTLKILNIDVPSEVFCSEGQDANINFFGSLRDYQEDFVEPIDFSEDDMIWNVPAGHGKCLGKGTPIRMFNGAIKNVEDVIVGDLLMGDDNQPRRVINLARGREMMYFVKQVKGLTYRVNESHILSLQKREIKGKYKYVDISVKDFISKNNNFKKNHKGYTKSCAFSKKTLPIDPYLLGLWLGDGNSRSFTITTDFKDEILINYFYKIADDYNTFIVVRPNKNCSDNYRFVGKTRRNNKLDIFLKTYNLILNKHIPFDFKTSSKEDRLNLLAGLIDTDGSYSNHLLEITQKRKQLILDIQDVCWSLGFKTNLSEKVIKSVTYYRLLISGDYEKIPTKLQRKKLKKRLQIKDPTVTGISLIKDCVDDYYGFTIDGNRRFMLADGTITHNTILTLWYLAQTKKKAIIFVNTNFLVNQWFNRIRDFSQEKALCLSSKINNINTIVDSNIIITTIQTYNNLNNRIVELIGRTRGIEVFDECFKGDTEILTDEGYKRFDQLQGNELVAQWHEGEISFVEPLRHIKKSYRGKMIKINLGYGRFAHLTENHQQVYSKDRHSTWMKRPIKDIPTNCYIPLTGKNVSGNSGLLSYEERLYIAIQADGTFQRKSKGSVFYSIQVTKLRKKRRLKYLLENYPPTKWKQIKGKKGVVRYMIEFTTKDLKFLSSCFEIHMHHERAVSFIEEIKLWDGSEESNNKNYRYYSSTIKENRDFVAAIASQGNYSTNSFEQEDDRKKSYKTIYRLTMYKDNTHKGTSMFNKSFYDYEGFVYCVEVPSGAIMVRSSGISYVSGNCHRMGAETYYPVLTQSIVKKRLALTATFRRGDNLQQILQFHFGNIYKMENKLPPPKTFALDTGVQVQPLIEKSKLSSVNLFRAILNEQDVAYKETESYFSFPASKIDFSDYVDLKVKDKYWIKRVSSDTTLVHIENFLSELGSRKRIARDLISEALENGRTVLFLSKRKALLKEFYEYFKNSYNCYLIIQETNKKTNLDEVSKKCQAVFGINALAQEALDIERLDTLILYHYISDTEQAIGRIARVHPDKKQPICFYLRDNCSQSFGMLNKAKRFIGINSEFVGTVSLKEAFKVL